MSKFIIILLLTSVANIQAQNSNQTQKSIKIGLSHAPPLIYLNEGEKPKGMLIDFIKDIAILENWDVHWVVGTWSEVIEKAKNNELDVMTYIAFTQERTQYFNFSYESFITGWGQVYTYDNTLFQSILDFDNKTIAVVKDDIHAIRFDELCKKFKINCQLKYVENYDVSFEMLENHEVEGAVCGSTVGHTYESSFNIFSTSVMFHPSSALFATPKDNDKEVLKVFDEYLLKWRQDPNSPYSISKRKWMNNAQLSKIPNWVKYLVFVILSLLLVSTLFVIFLRKQIKKHIQQHVDQSNQLNQIINLVPHMIYVVNSEGNVVLVNKYASDYFGVSNSLSTTNHQLLAKVPQYRKLFEDDFELLNNGSGLINKTIQSTNSKNEEITFSVSKVPFESSDNLLSVLTVGVDKTEEITYQKQIQYIAEHDDLTGLPNRQLLMKNISKSIEGALTSELSGAVLFLDLDYFKNINDSLGHAAGDKLLIEICQRLQSLVNEEDMIARIGGDEFIIHLNNFSADLSQAKLEVNKMARKILGSIAKKIVIDSHDLYISASIGIVMYPENADSYDQIMQRSDIAMYHAKSLGRNNFVVFKQTMEDVILRRHQLVADLRKALDNSEFFIEYQPQIQGNDKRIIGFEALIRWKHPSGEIIQPKEFIRVAEECGLIIPIGNWVLEQVCKQIQTWLKKYKSIPFVTVNLSVIQIHNKGLVDYLRLIFRKYSIQPNFIELEVTESVMIKQIDNTVYTLSELKNLGVRLSIDDFGTEYSSLSYLKKLPFDKLKIDYSFIKDITKDSDTRTLVKTIIGMAQDLGLEVIAEGVENIEQLNMLKKMGCNNYQGYLFDKPQSVTYIEEKYLEASFTRRTI